MCVDKRPDVELLRQARSALADWQEQVIASIQTQGRSAIAACETAYEVRMTLARVQDHQLV